jgi:hypothetical protein
LEAELQGANPNLTIRVRRDRDYLIMTHRRNLHAWWAEDKADFNPEPIQKYVMQ